MKAGIYKTPNDNLVYVAKDRTILATTLSPSAWPGNKVATLNKERFVAFFGLTAERVCDVPNGCTNPKEYVGQVKKLFDFGPTRLSDFSRMGDGARRQYILSLEEPAIAIEGIDLDGISDLHTDEELRRHVVDGEPLPKDPPFTSGGEWPGNFYYNLEPMPGDICVEFEDKGQDFLRWVIREDEQGVSYVVQCSPAQEFVWVGLMVHNAENVAGGRTDRLYVQRGNNDAVYVNYRVIHSRVVSLPDVTSRTDAYETAAKTVYETTGVPSRLLGKPSALGASYAEGGVVKAPLANPDELFGSGGTEEVMPKGAGKSSLGPGKLYTADGQLIGEVTSMSRLTPVRHAVFRPSYLSKWPCPNTVRFCNKQSARKHRKQGHRVWWDNARGMYAWSAQ